MLEKLGKYNKLWIALIGAGVAFAGHYFGITNEYYQLVVGLLTAAGVYAAPNNK